MKRESKEKEKRKNLKIISEKEKKSMWEDNFLKIESKKKEKKHTSKEVF